MALGHQAVIGIGQRAVWRKAHGLARGQQLGEARVLGNAKAPAQRIGHQAVDGHGPQPLAFQAQQGGGIGRQHGAQGCQQAAKALALRQVLGQVGHQGGEGVQGGGCGHKDCDGCQKDSI